MMRDTGRGWAWTRALLGVMAEEIHLCGEEGAVELVKSLMSTTGEDVEVSCFSVASQKIQGAKYDTYKSNRC